jgi:hypothetical protein
MSDSTEDRIAMKVDVSGTNILELPVKKLQPLEEQPFLLPPPAAGCGHWRGFTVDEKAGKCFCRECKGEVSPMFVLGRLMNQESRWRQTLEKYQDAMKRLDERERTKCRHCGKMTPISGR